MFNIVDIIGPVLTHKVIENAKKSASAYAGRQKTNLSPSVDFMCPRKSYFNFKFSGKSYLSPLDDDFSYTNERAKVVGNNFHSYIESILKSTGVLRCSETTLIDEEHHIKARLDMIVEINNQLYLVELKSAKAYSVKMMLQEGSPDIEHQKQLQLYFHLYEKNKDTPELFAVLQGRPLTRGILLYEDKDGHKVTEFMVNKNQTMIKGLLDYADLVIRSVKTGTEPTFTFEPDSRECMYKCKAQYYELCHGKTRVDPRKAPIDTEKTGGALWGTTDANKLIAEEKFL